MLHSVEVLEELGHSVVLLTPTGEEGVGRRFPLSKAGPTKLVELNLSKQK
jgi:hypothetical protein